MIYVIGGTTASGKSELAFRFAHAINGIIINADAFAVYRELKIGTAKPSAEKLNNIENFMFNVRSINDEFSIYDYQQEVRAIIAQYQKLNRPIIIVGGSGLYIRSVLYDYQFTKEKQKIDESRYLHLSNTDLHAKLTAVDAHSAAKIHPNNRKRVLRALAISEFGGETKSEQLMKQKKEPLFSYILVILDQEKERLNTMITSRVQKMFNLGLRNEVEELIKQFPPDLQALQAIGYKEIITHPAKDDVFLINLIAHNTIKFAKRQRTFFRNQFVGKFIYNHDEAFRYLSTKHKEISDAQKN